LFVGIWSCARLAVSALAAHAAEPPPPPPVLDAPEAWAVDEPPPFRSEPLGLGDALGQAALHNPELGAAAQDVQISEARVLAAQGAFDVEVTANITGSTSRRPQRGSQFAFDVGRRSVGGGFGVRRALETGGAIALQFDTQRLRIDQPNDPTNAGAGRSSLAAFAVVPTLTLNHALLRGAGLKVNRAGIARAKVAKTAAAAAQQAAAQRVARDLVRGYWDLLFAHRDLANKQRSAALVRAQIDRTAKLVRAGKRSRLDARAIEQALAAREADVSRAENALLVASLAVRRAMGQSIGGRDTLGLQPSTDPQVQPRALVIEDEVARALEGNATLRQLELEQAALGIDVKVAANARLPRLDVAATFSPQGRSIDTRGDAANGVAPRRATWGQAFGNMFGDDARADGVLADWSFTGSITLTWDVQNRAARGAHQEAKLTVEQARQRLAAAREDVSAQVIGAASALRAAGKTIVAAELSEELARENLAAEQSKFELGRATNYDVLLRLDELDAAAGLALAARVEYLAALAELQLLTGEILVVYGLTGG
jgi:outer membrane protein